MNAHLVLVVAIVAEVAATAALKASDGFSKLGPAAVAAVGYAIALYLLSLTLKTIPVGIAYAVWSGVGIVLISAVGWIVFGQRPDAPAIIGLVLIVSGVLIVNLLSRSTGH